MESLIQMPVFDGHNDTLEMLYISGKGAGRSFFEESATGHIDLPRAKAGGLSGGLFSIFVPSPSKMHTRPGADLSEAKISYAVPMASSIEQDYAFSVTAKGLAGLFRLEAAAEGGIKVVCSMDEIERCFHENVLAVVIHFEGAEAIDVDLDALYLFYRAGLRSIGITWSRNNAFAHGVPYRFPESPDTGPGLTEAGKRLIRECNTLGILIDVSHLNEKGFWDIEKLSRTPLVATHSGAHALCPSTRNLTDKQLDAIAASEGIVGVNFHVAFLRSDGRLDERTPMDEIVRHIDYIAERIGIEHVAFGSDFDGATMPKELGDAAGLPKLIHALRDHGYDDGALELITHKNWFRVIKDSWKVK